jgi:hypothetical protein
MPKSGTPPYELWVIWKYLPFLEKLFLLVLCIVGVYFLLTTGATLWRLTATRNAEGNLSSARRTLCSLQKRISRFEEIECFMFYLFGLELFIGLQRAYITIDNSNVPVGWLVLNNFIIQFAFAANAFLLFLIIHCIKWSASGLANRHAAQMNTENVKS